MPLGTKADGAPSVAAPSENAWDTVFAEGRSFGDATPLDTGSETTAPQTDSESSAGALPGRPESAPPDPTGDDGAGASALAPPRSADPAPIAPAPQTDSDPLAGAAPFTYTVDGKPETIEGAYHLKGDGLYVPEEHVPHWQLMASQAKTLDRENRTLRDQTQAENQTWQRLTTHTFRDDKNTEQTLTGVRGLEALRFEAAADKAALHAVVKVLSDPNAFANLVDFIKVDAQGNQVAPETEGPGLRWFPVRKEDTWNALVRDSALSVRELKLKVRDDMQKLSAPPPPPEPSVTESAMPTLESIIAEHKITGLTAQDKQFLAGQFELYVRPTTPQERQRFGSPKIVDNRYTEAVKERAALRAEAAKALTTGKKADAFNSGMEKGRLPAPTPRQAAPTPPTFTGRNAPKTRTEASPNDMWASLVEDARQAAL